MENIIETIKIKPFTTSDISILIPFIILFFTSIIPLTTKVLNKNTEPRRGYTFLVALVGLVCALMLNIFQFEINSQLAFHNTVIFDGLTSLGNVLAIIITIFTLFLMYRHSGIPGHQYSEYVFLLFSTVIGIFIINFSNDLILSFIGIETMSLPLYVLIGAGGNDKITKEASFKYFVLGSFASAFLLYGIALIYGALGHTQIDELLKHPETIQMVYFKIGFIIFLIGLFFKVAVIPFHSWVPDVYQGAPTPITGFMAAAVKLVIFCFLIRVIPLANLMETHILVTAFQWIAVLTMFLGSLAALYQTNLKRLMAYSSIAHSGYLFMGILAAMKGNYEDSLFGIVVYLVLYIFMTIGVFGIIGVFERRQEMQLSIEDLKGLAQRKPFLAFCFAVLLLSLGGVPPFVGFFAKVFIFSTAINAGLYWLAVWGVISSVVSVYYYLKPVVYMYMYKSEEPLQDVKSYAQKTAIFISTAIIIFGGFFMQPLIEILHQILF